MTAPPETIYALSSAPGAAGVAVFRVSGPRAQAVVEALSGTPCPPPREAVLRSLRHAGTQIDRALVLSFTAPASFTGEDVVEFHTHGGRAVIHAMGEALAAQHGCRLAQPGEFTRRAFENGKLDLTEAEAIADLIAAQTAAQRVQALDQLGGGLKHLYEGWAATLTRALAYAEAAIDFSEEEIAPEELLASILPPLQRVRDALTRHLDDRRRGERLRDGVRVAILGAPNAGKSSLLNAIAGREAAIVSATPGTTRDVVEVTLDLSGYPIVLSDTAGLRDTLDEIESEGIRRALAQAEAADIQLIVIDGTAPALPEAMEALLRADADAQRLVALNKTDLLADIDGAVAAITPAIMSTSSVAPLPATPLPVAAATGVGLDALLAALASAVQASLGTGAAESGPALTRARHREALTTCRDALARALDQTASMGGPFATPELVAEDIRLALRTLGSITGRVDVEDLLDIIFRDFCIGK